MKHDLIHCVVRIAQGDRVDIAEIPRAGAGALTPMEAAILIDLHSVGDDPMDAGGCAVRGAYKAGEVERTKHEEMERLSGIYGRERVRRVFPMQGMAPLTIDDLDLPRDNRIDPPKPKKAAEDTESRPSLADERKTLTDKIEAAGLKLPDGKLTIDDLRAMAKEVA